MVKPYAAGWGRSGRPWERLKAQVFAEETHCHCCRSPVDQTLPHNHPKARSVDHLIPRDKRPDLAYERGNLRLAHRGCNSTRGNRMRARGTHTDRGTISINPATV